MNGLMLHCGAKKIDEPALRALPTPVGTNTHIPIAHSHLLDVTRNELKKSNFEITNQAHGCMTDGNKYFGLLEVRHTHKDYGIVVGLRNSHNKEVASGITVGDRVFVCDNMAFAGDLDLLLRKHTLNILEDLPQLVGGLVNKINQQVQIQDKRIEYYKDGELSIQEGNDALAKMYLNNKPLLGVTNFGKVVEEYNKPDKEQHEDFRDKNVWRLRNSVTEVMKGGKIFDLPYVSRFLNKTCDRLSGFNPKEIAQAA